MSLTESKLIAAIPRNNREEVRVALSEYRGKTRLDLRCWYIDANGEHRPGKQGIGFPIEQLPAWIDALQKALEAK